MNAKARSYANDEARANAVAQGADQTLAYYQQVNNSARVILAEQEQKIAKLNDDYKSRAITKEKFQQEFASSNLDQNNLNQQLQGIDKQLATMRSDPQAGMLAARINSLQTERDTLKATYDKLLQLYGTVPAEVRTGV
jgi:predicted  nucleic acid-binding Zn-ribbon protein